MPRDLREVESCLGWGLLPRTGEPPPSDGIREDPRRCHDPLEVVPRVTVRLRPRVSRVLRGGVGPLRTSLRGVYFSSGDYACPVGGPWRRSSARWTGVGSLGRSVRRLLLRGDGRCTRDPRAFGPPQRGGEPYVGGRYTLSDPGHQCLPHRSPCSLTIKQKVSPVPVTPTTRVTCPWCNDRGPGGWTVGGRCVTRVVLRS